MIGDWFSSATSTTTVEPMNSNMFALDWFSSASTTVDPAASCAQQYAQYTSAIHLHSLITSDVCQSFILLPFTILLLHYLFAHVLHLDIFLTIESNIYQQLQHVCGWCGRCGRSNSVATTAGATLACYTRPFYEDQVHDLSSTLILGIQKQLCLSHTYYQGTKTYAPVPVAPSMFTARRAVVEQTQPRDIDISDTFDTSGTSRSSGTAEINKRQRTRTRTRSGKNESSSSSSSLSSSSSAAATHTTRSIKFVEHAPAIFHNLRMLYGVEDVDIAQAFDLRQEGNMFSSPTGPKDEEEMENSENSASTSAAAAAATTTKNTGEHKERKGSQPYNTGP